MKRAFFFLVFIFLINLPGLYYQWYLNYWWFDVVLHFLGGFFIAMFFAAYLDEHILGTSKLKNALVIIGAAMFVGVVWEFAEYIANQTLTEPFYRYFEVRAYFMGDLSDTVNDLTMDMLGAASFAWLHLLRRGKSPN
ncbi:MAG: hypothetical protein WD989_01050 [Candidatus Paceibacterota bacterium]